MSSMETRPRSATAPINVIYSVSYEKLRSEIFTEIRDLQREWPNERCILLVPERLKLSYEHSFLEFLAPDGGEAALLLAEVLSFTRFSMRLLDQGGSRGAAPLPQAQMTLILSGILQRERDRFACFGRLSTKPGFMQDLARLIGDCRRYLTRPEDLRAVRDRLTGQETPERSLIDRLGDLALLLEFYEARLHTDRLEDAGQIIAEAAELLSNADVSEESYLKWLAGTHIYISGFGDTRDFTPQEYALLQALARRCRAITIAVSADHEPQPNEPAENGTRIFQPGRQTLITLREQFPSIRIKQLPTEYPAETFVVAKAFAPQLPTEAAQSAKNETVDPPIDSQGEPRFRLVYTTTPEAEVDLLAAKIKELVETGVCRYRDIAVLPLDQAAYLPLLKASFRVFEIPAYLDTPQALAGSPLRALILGIVNLARFGWEPEICWSVLRTGLLDLTMSEVDILENASLARGIDRRSFWDDTRYIKDVSDAERAGALRGSGDGQSGIGRAEARSSDDVSGEFTSDDSTDTGAIIDEIMFDDESEERLIEPRIKSDRSSVASYADDSLLQLRNRAFKVLRIYVERLRRTNDVADRARILLDTLTGLHVQSQVESLIADYEAGFDDTSAVGLAQGWNLMIDLLNLFVDEGPEINYGLADFHNLLDHGISASMRQAIPSRIDMILVGQAEEVAHFEHRFLFILGANRDKLPGYTAPRGLLSSVERQYLHDNLPHGFSFQEDRMPAARYHLIWEYLTTANHLTLMHSGKTSDASAVLQLIRESATNPEVLTPGGKLAGRLDIRHFEALDEKARISLREELERKRDLKISEGLISGLQSSPLNMSVSRLERYQTCGYYYLQKDLLKIGERQIYKPEMNHMGTYLHKIFEIFYKDLAVDLQSLQNHEVPAYLAKYQAELEGGLLPFTVDRLMKQAVQEEGELRIFDEPVFRGSYTRKVRNLTANTLIATLAELRTNAEGFIPTHQEWTFGMEGNPALYVESESGLAVNFRGQVDRIDIREAGPNLRTFRIVDYKSGTKKVDYNRLWHGLDLQLPIYLEAVLEHGNQKEQNDWSAHDAMYYSLKPDKEKPKNQVSLDLMKPNLTDKRALSVPVASLGLEPEDLPLLTEHTLNKAREGLDNLQAGKVGATPRGIRDSKLELPCRFCPFSGVCQIERPGFNYEELPKVQEVWKETSADPTAKPPTAKQSLAALIHKEASASEPGLQNGSTHTKEGGQ